MAVMPSVPVISPDQNASRSKPSGVVTPAARIATGSARRGSTHEGDCHSGVVEKLFELALEGARHGLPRMSGRIPGVAAQVIATAQPLLCETTSTLVDHAQRDVVDQTGAHIRVTLPFLQRQQQRAIAAGLRQRLLRL